MLCCFVRHFVAAAIWKEAPSDAHVPGIRYHSTAKATIEMYTTSRVLATDGSSFN